MGAADVDAPGDVGSKSALLARQPWPMAWTCKSSGGEAGVPEDCESLAMAAL